MKRHQAIFFGGILCWESPYTFSNVTAVHSIAATFIAKTYEIAASVGTNGSISPSGSVSVTQGASQAFAITANTGYQVKDVLVDGASVGAVASYTFSNVTAVHSIAATFIAKTYSIAASAGTCLLYTSPSPRDRQKSRMPSSA